ncbi:hypothetical protein [Pseudoscardovia suis]|uniref:Phage helicase n=1 Tax=Pseudoscardovia suis TaxID=987063 RepID=A0A261F0W9_9BIFI|nr:hypothetical protein [Pseudoscardovia suis]OZG52770.1 hypothetical protein PSSU_0388 [Pseudoscardovia suis]PJJ64945.1 hypothetical protein CLV65_1497 [Pseudoscardovia suis]
MPDNTSSTPQNEPTQEPTQGAAQQQQQQPSQAPADPVEPHGDPDTTIDWKAQARKWEKLAKANHEKAEQADQLREKAEKADQLQAQLDKLNAAQAWEKTIGKVSGETGIPVDVLNIVKADSEDKLAEAAKTLQAFAQTGARRTGMGDQSREPAAPQPSGAAAFLAKVNQHAGH